MLRAAWKSLLARKVRLLMSTFAIVLGVAFVAGTFVFTDTLHRSFTAIFDASVGDVMVRPAAAARNQDPSAQITLPGSVVDRVRGVEGVARADGIASGSGVFVIGADNRVVGGAGAPGLWSSYSDAPAAGDAERLSVIAGRPPTRKGEVVLDTDTARRAGVYVGERVKLASVGRRALLQPRLVGLADYPSGGASLNGASIAIFAPRVAQQLFLDGKDVWSQVWVTADPGVSASDLRDRISRVLPQGVRAVTGATAAKQSASDLLNAISFLTVFLLVFAGIALVVGAFLIVNTFSILVAQRSRELALFRALGASRRQVTRSVLFEAFVVGAVGSALGLGLGLLLAVGIRALFASFGLDLGDTPLVIAPRTPIAAVVVGLVVTMVSAYLPARRSSRIPPVAALRDDIAMPASSLRLRLLLGGVMTVAGAAAGLLGLYGEVAHRGYWVGGGALLAMLGMAAASPSTSRPFLHVVAAGYRGIFGAVGRLAGQNTLRNPRRTAATASALMIGLTLVTTMSIAGASAKASVDAAVEKSFLGDIVISNAAGQPFSPQIARIAGRQQGVASVTRMRFGEARLRGERRFVGAVDPRHLADVMRLQVVQGSLESFTGDTLIVQQDRARQLGIGLGDRVTLDFPRGRQSLRVAAVFSGRIGVSLLTTLDAFAKAGYPPRDSSLLLDLEPGADAAAVKHRLEEATSKLPIITVKNQREYAAEQRAPIDQMVLMIYALLGFALVIAVLGVVNTLGLSVIERTREIGLLRAIGLDRRRLRRMIALESVAISLLGAALGLALGTVFGVALMASLKNQGLEVVVVPWSQLAAYLASAVVIGLLAAAIPARRAARLDVLRAIATE